MSYRIGQVAAMSRVSVRTLRHYDEIGLLRPTLRSDAGYRLYTDGDLIRLKHILFYKTIGFSLEAIDRSLNDPNFDFHKALLEQQQQLLQQQHNVDKQLQLVNKLLSENQEAGKKMKQSSFTAFERVDPSIYEEEVEQRWGNTDAFRESAQRTKGYTKADWKEIKTENQEIITKLAALFNQGIAPTDSQAIQAVDSYRLHIDRWYYPCSKKMHANLGLMYVEDPRFKATFEQVQTGLAQFIYDATLANAKQ